MRSINPQIWAGQNLPDKIIKAHDNWNVSEPMEEVSYSDLSYSDSQSTMSGILSLSESDIQE